MSGSNMLQCTTEVCCLAEVGERHHEDARNIIVRIFEANEGASINSAPEGNLSVTTPAQFGKAYPDVDDAAYDVDRVVSLVEGGMDVVSLIGHLPDAELNKALGQQVPRLLCALDDYLAYLCRGCSSDFVRHIINANKLRLGIDLCFELRPSTMLLSMAVRA